MIPLRLLHLVPDPAHLTAQAARPVLDALTAAGHLSGWLCPAASSPDGRAVVGFTPGWWRWWRGERSRTMRRVAEWAPDLLHVHALDHLGAGLDLARRLGLAVVASIDRIVDPHSARRLRDPLIGWVLVPTEHHRAHYLSRVGIPRNRLAILPSGAAIAAAPTAKTGPGWTVGGFGDGSRQACRRFVTAVAEVQRGGLPLRALWWTRDRRELLLLRALATDANAEITLHTNNDLAEFLQDSDVLALPGTGETPSAVVIAAMARGIPVAGLVADGLPELVRDGTTGVLIPADDADGLEQALRHLHDPERRLAYAVAAQEVARTSFAAPLIAEATLEVYRAVLGSPGASATAEITSAWRRVSRSGEMRMVR